MASVIPHIIDQHAEEAAFLWLLRNNAVDAPHYDLDDLAKLDDRVEAHIDGLRIAGDYGWQACLDNLQFKEAGEVFAAAVLALESHSVERINHIYKIVEEAPEAINGLVSAFGWVGAENLQGTVKDLLESTKPIWRQIGLSACSIHRVDPKKILDVAVQDDDIEVRVQALRLVGELGRLDLKPVLLEQLKDEDKQIKFWAAWSAVLVGDRGSAVHSLINEIESGSEYCISAMQLILPLLNSQSVKKTLKVLADNKETLRLAIMGSGISGDTIYVPWLIQQMSDPEHAKIAGEAFSHLCGVDLAYQDMEAELAESESFGPTENPDDEEVAMDPDEDLPCPDPVLVQKWWQENSDKFRAKLGYRYIYGKQSSQSHYQWLLKNGTQRLRYSAALALALINPEAVLFEVHAVGKRQQKALV
mgnify:FL=1